MRRNGHKSINWTEENVTAVALSSNLISIAPKNSQRAHRLAGFDI
jgi:hypothetical protein